jgi:predicted Rossmann fold flavoprotein
VSVSVPWNERDVVVIGGGAAGCMAAIFAASRGGRVLLLEGTRDGGRKILISGGGRCNVLPSALRPEQYVTASSPNTLRKMLLSWPLGEQRRFFEEDLGLPLALEKETGKLFPVSNRARDVRDRLIARVRELGGEIWFESRAKGLEPLDPIGWRVHLSDGRMVDARRVVVATGGLSVPNTGSDGAGFAMVRELGHSLNTTYPALTPLTCDPPLHGDLAGISLEVELNAPLRKGRFVTEGGFLFTHRGYSGPSVLNVSHLAVLSLLEGGERQRIEVRWTALDAGDWERLLSEGGGATAGSLVRRHLPDRLAEAMLGAAGVEAQRPLSQLRRTERKRLIETLTAYPLPWTGDEGYRKAEVTGGGVALAEVDARTMESRIRPGLHLCGEILDAFGPIGGYNFAWAWATGRAAGLAAAAEPA